MKLHRFRIQTSFPVRFLQNPAPIRQCRKELMNTVPACPPIPKARALPKAALLPFREAPEQKVPMQQGARIPQRKTACCLLTLRPLPIPLSQEGSAAAGSETAQTPTDPAAAGQTPSSSAETPAETSAAQTPAETTAQTPSDTSGAQVPAEESTQLPSVNTGNALTGIGLGAAGAVQ